MVGFGRESVSMEAGAEGSGSSESELEPESDNGSLRRRLDMMVGEGGGGNGKTGRDQAEVGFGWVREKWEGEVEGNERVRYLRQHP